MEDEFVVWAVCEFMDVCQSEAIGLAGAPNKGDDNTIQYAQYNAIQYDTHNAIVAGGRLIKGVTGKLRSDDTARLSRGVAVSSSHLSSSSFLWSFTHFISGNPDLKIWSFGAFFISQTNKSGIKRTRKQHGHKSSYWSLTFRWIQSTCWKKRLW